MTAYLARRILFCGKPGSTFPKNALICRVCALFPSLATVLLMTHLGGCNETWNDPYPAAERGRNILYAAFTDRPKHLDPTQSYSEDEARFIAQIYEPPLQYHYLKRPVHSYSQYRRDDAGPARLRRARQPRRG